MAKNKGKNNANDTRGDAAEVTNTNNAQAQNKSGGKKGGTQNKAGGQDCR